MHDALALQSRDLARETFALLQSIDASRWRDARVAEVAALGEQIATRARQIREDAGPWPSEAMRTRFAELSAAFDAYRPVDSAASARAAWASFRAQLLPAYEALAVALKEESLPVPSLRPTNYTRSAFHAASSVGAIVAVEALLPDAGRFWVMLSVATFAWCLEIGRKLSPALNNFLLSTLRLIAHPHERYRINSSTWYMTALFILSPLTDRMTAAAALAVVGLADPFAGLIGRRWGRTTLREGRSLQGTLAFFAMALLATAAVLSLWHGELGAARIAVLTLAAAVPGTLAELYLPRPDDNFTIPLASAAGISLAALGLGLI